MQRRYYTVAGISGPVALLVDDDNHQTAFPMGRLPRGAKGGSLLAVPLNAAGTPSWADAEIDDDEAKRRAAGTSSGIEEAEKGEER
ncbi:MAG: hypothetical protein JSW51_03415 [Gemmatimonadota bacterium]|nr:MAG: hypothetical protein JSW51_03415 [Gemmatimonadota bacterium]